jgi:hypothetical protein
MKRFAVAGLLALSIACQSELAVADVDTVGDGAELRRAERDRDRLGWYVPDFAKLQTAGFLGSVGVGFGYALFNDVTNVSLFYGFTPATRAGNNVHAGKLAIDVRPFDLRLNAFRLVPIYIGGSLLYAFGSEYFTRLPDRYARIDQKYYPPTALHWSAQLGFELDYVPARGAIERHGLYYEAVTIDSYLDSLFKNSGRVGLTDVFSSSVGYRLAF